MWSDSPLELRVEVYYDGELPATLAEKIAALLAHRWPVALDAEVPAHVSFEHPAEWRAVVPFVEGTTPQSLHQQLAAELLAVDPSRSRHIRTPWAFQQSPHPQAGYAERWKPEGQ